MPIHVTLHIFSGRPDPVWELSETQSRQLAERLAAAPERSLQKPPGLAGGIGYQGFTVHSSDTAGLAAQTYIHAGLADIGQRLPALALGDVEVERFLLDTAGDAVSPAVRAAVAKALDRPLSAMADRASPRLGAPPPFNPGRWNTDPNVMENNNCYNYANDKITNTFAQPGRGSGQVYQTDDCLDVSDASVRDGQSPGADPDSEPDEGQIICLVIWPDEDFHWYRKDEDGLWSHKPGSTPAINTDDSGNLIQSPETCDRGEYTVVCGYYHSVPALTHIA